jgi:hypothetical protein
MSVEADLEGLVAVIRKAQTHQGWCLVTRPAGDDAKATVGKALASVAGECDWRTAEELAAMEDRSSLYAAPVEWLVLDGFLDRSGESEPAHMPDDDWGPLFDATVVAMARTEAGLQTLVAVVTCPEVEAEIASLHGLPGCVPFSMKGSCA